MGKTAWEFGKDFLAFLGVAFLVFWVGAIMGVSMAREACKDVSGAPSCEVKWVPKR